MVSFIFKGSSKVSSVFLRRKVKSWWCNCAYKANVFRVIHVFYLKMAPDNQPVEMSFCMKQCLRVWQCEISRRRSLSAEHTKKSTAIIGRKLVVKLYQFCRFSLFSFVFSYLQMFLSVLKFSCVARFDKSVSKKRNQSKTKARKLVNKVIKLQARQQSKSEAMIIIHGETK